MKPMLFILLTLTVALSAGAQEKPRLTRLYTSSSGDYPLSARGPDALENAALLGLAEEAYKTFLQTTGNASLAGFALRVTWDSAPLLPPYDPFAEFPRKVELGADGTRTFVVMVRGGFANNGDAASLEMLREQFYRSCMACYVQALVWSGNVVVREGSLAEPPFWLREGLTQLMMKSRHETYAKIARNYQQQRRMPELAQVQEWDGFTDDALSSRWRQAFVYWLVRLASREAASRQALSLWLSSGDYAREHSFLAPSPRNESWWHDIVSEQPAQLFQNYDWDRTVAWLNQYRHLSVVLKPEKAGKEEPARVLAMQDLPSPKRLQSVGPVRERIDELAKFQLKAHPAWRKIIEFYRLTLELWLTDNQPEYKKCLAAIEEQERGVYQYMALVGDYMDWVTVNTPVNFIGSAVPSQSKFTAEMVRASGRLGVPLPAEDELPAKP